MKLLSLNDMFEIYFCSRNNDIFFSLNIIYNIFIRFFIGFNIYIIRNDNVDKYVDSILEFLCLVFDIFVCNGNICYIV